VKGYRPMALAQLAVRLADTADDKLRWKLVWEFLEEYQWEPPRLSPHCWWMSRLQSATSAGTLFLRR
jgi:hypothetical protein